MPDYTIPAEHRLDDLERAQLAQLARLIPADHSQLWSDAALLRSACRATERPIPDCSRSTRGDAPAGVALNARALLQIMREPRLPYACRCGQLSGDVKVCDTCRAVEREPQGETVRLFAPAPNVIPGQQGFAV